MRNYLFACVEGEARFAWIAHGLDPSLGVLHADQRNCDSVAIDAMEPLRPPTMEAARKALAGQSAEGNDPRRSAAVNRVRGEAISEGHRRNRSWVREHPGQRDEVWFKREVAPRFDAFSRNEIAAATGLSLAACSCIRACAKVPHPRHWEALKRLVDS